MDLGLCRLLWKGPQRADEVFIDSFLKFTLIQDPDIKPLVTVAAPSLLPPPPPSATQNRLIGTFKYHCCVLDCDALLIYVAHRTEGSWKKAKGTLRVEGSSSEMVNGVYYGFSWFEFFSIVLFRLWQRQNLSSRSQNRFRYGLSLFQ